MTSRSAEDFDQYFSPSTMAQAVADVLVSRFEHSTDTHFEVVDFCAGLGSLLEVVSERLPAACIVATDLDVSCLRLLREAHPLWSVGRIDILNERSRRASPLYVEGRYDAFVINPPFSGRGGRVVNVTFDRNLHFTCSRPLACLFHSLQSLRIGGFGVAVLPLSCLRSEKDSVAVRWLERNMDFSVHSYHGRGCFSGASVRTVIVSLRRNRVADVASVNAVGGQEILPRGRRGSDLVLFRGKVPVRTLRSFHSDGDGVVVARYVHTTDLRKTWSGWRTISVNSNVCLVREGVLFPRVGKISPNSFRAYSDSVPLVLSDCVFSVSPVCASVALDDLLSILRENCRVFVESSAATGAPYLTVSQVLGLIDRLGFSVRVHQCRNRCLCHDSF